MNTPKIKWDYDAMIQILNDACAGKHELTLEELQSLRQFIEHKKQEGK